MTHKLIKNVRIVDDGKDFIGDVYIKGDRIEKIAPGISLSSHLSFDEINAERLVLIPGMIDAHVHFREPGLTYKGDMRSESSAAIAGGITSIMDMPNTDPAVLSIDVLEQKYARAAASCHTNYSFFMGLSKDNLEEALRVSSEDVCGLTDDGLYFDEEHPTLCNSISFLEKIFSSSPHLIALHSEDDTIIRNNYIKCKKEYGEFIPPSAHTQIRSVDACFHSSKSVTELAAKHNTRLHLLHISTGKEAGMFNSSLPLKYKRITSETTIHHLCFNTEDYDRLGNLIKWNPSVKYKSDNQELLEALKSNQIDIVATDHAPHAIGEKIGLYDRVKPGGPMVQHALLALLDFYHQGKLSLNEVVQKTSNGVAELYRIKERGFIREGYFADLVLVDLKKSNVVREENLLYKCNWSPFLFHEFKSSIDTVIINGEISFTKNKICASSSGYRLKFEKIR